MSGLAGHVCAIGAILALCAAAGFTASPALFARGAARAGERAAWSFCVGLLLIEGCVALALAVSLRPGWLAFLLLSGVAVLASRLLPALPQDGAPSALPPSPRSRLCRAAFLCLAVAGALLYLLRALTEPMWAADFLAIWGWKGKVLFGAGTLPDWMWRMPAFGFTHPEYPVGLPLIDAGIAFLIGSFDDHAMALLDPALQVGTLCLLWGWLRRRGVPPAVSLGASAALALFEPLYSAFTTGMADVPLSSFLLLLGTSMVDALAEEPGALRRLILAAAGAALLKNEGLLAAAAVAGLSLAAGRARWPARARAAVAALLPAAAVLGCHRLWRGALPLRDFRLGLLVGSDFPARFELGLRTIVDEAILPAAPGLAAFGLLVWAGRRAPAGDRLLALAGILVAIYAALPSLCVWGPEWLVRTAFARTAAALAPLAAAGTALRLSSVFWSSGESSGSAAGRAA